MDWDEFKEQYPFLYAMYLWVAVAVSIVVAIGYMVVMIPIETVSEIYKLIRNCGKKGDDK